MPVRDDARHRGAAALVVVALLGCVVATSAVAGPADPDPSFATGGLAVREFTPDAALSGINDAVIDAQGRIVVAGILQPAGAAAAHFAVARFTATGDLDPTFNGRGSTPGVVTVTPGGSARSAARSIALAPDGRIVAAGDSGGRTDLVVVARFTASGTLDRTFNSGGSQPGVFSSTLGESGADAHGLVLDGAARPLVAGSVTSSTGERRMMILRLTTAGMLDPTFAQTAAVPGVATRALGEAQPKNARAFALTLDPAGKPILAGATDMAGRLDTQFTWARFSAAGDFERAAFAKFSEADRPSLASSVLVDGSGRIVLAGLTIDGASRVALARFLPDGTLDPNFGPDPAAPGRSTLLVGAESRASRIFEGPNGTLLVAGAATEGALLARFTSSGQPDGTFANGQSSRTYASGVAGTTGFATLRPLGGGLLVAAGVAGSKAFLARVGGTASAPLASFTFAAVPPPAGKPIRPDQPVTFHSTSVPGDPGAALVDQAWDLDGDGTFENITASPSRSFGAPGDYTVRLRVSDDRGLAATTSRTLSVIANKPPVAAFGPRPPQVGDPRGAASTVDVAPNPIVNVPYTIDAGASSDPDGSIHEYKFDLDGDGTPERRQLTSDATTHTFGSVGDRTIGLRVNDDEFLLSEMVTRKVTVRPADFKLDPITPGSSSSARLAVAAGAKAVAELRVTRGPGSIGDLTVKTSATSYLLTTSGVLGPAKQQALKVTVAPQPSTPPGKYVVDVFVRSTPQEGGIVRSVGIPVEVLPAYDAAIQGVEVIQATQDDLGNCHLQAVIAAQFLPPGFKDETRRRCALEPSLPVGKLNEATDSFDAKYKGVPLVADKQTVVRVFAAIRAGESTSKFSATLTAWRKGKQLGPITPITPARKLEHDSDLHVTMNDRGNDERAITFVLPPSWTAGAPLRLQADLKVAGSAASKAPKECPSPACAADNHFNLTDVLFTDPGGLRVGLVRIYHASEHKEPGFGPGSDAEFGVTSPLPTGPMPQKSWPSPGDVMDTAQALFPLPDGELVFSPNYMAALDFTDIAVGPETSKEKKHHARSRLQNLIEEGGFCWDFCPAEIIGITGRTLSEDGGGVSSGNFFDNIPASIAFAENQMTVAHELLHGWELRHSHGERCLGETEDQEGDAIDANGWGFTNGDKLDPRGWLPGRTPSKPFVTKSPSFGPLPFSSDLYDVMSYCADSAQERWIAPAMWRRALSQRQKRKGASSSLRAAQAAAMSPASALTPAAPIGRGFTASARGFTASARAAQAGGGLLAVYATDVDGALKGLTVARRTKSRRRAPGQSAYRVEVLDARGAVLAAAPLAASALSDDAGAALAGEVLAPNGARALRVMRDDIEIGRRDASPSRPQVQLRLPRRTTVVRGGSLRISWAATDADGLAPLATVSYSADGGRAWRTVALTTRSSVTVDRSQLAPSRHARVRISVSDGFHESAVLSKSFRVEGVPPAASILSPRRGGRGTAGAPLYLAGSAIADGGKDLAGRALRWYVGRRLIGRGKRVAATGLPPGRAVVRLVARDANGKTAEVRRTVSIGAAEPDLTVLRAPKRLSRKARSVVLRVASSFPSTLRVAGRRVRVTPRVSSVRVAIRPGLRALRLRLVVSSGRQRASALLVINRR